MKTNILFILAAVLAITIASGVKSRASKDSASKESASKDSASTHGSGLGKCKKNNGGCEHICTKVTGSGHNRGQSGHKGRECSCHEGYELAADDESCNDIDECQTNDGGCQQNCTNSEGSYSCSCSAGYVLDTNGLNCNDIDECQTNDGGCEQNCTNSEGSYSCSCSDGYNMDTNGLHCIACLLLPTTGYTCTTSGTWDNSYLCHFAYDGRYSGEWPSEWATRYGSDGAWMEITFPGTVTVCSIKLWQRCIIQDSYGKYELTFSNSTSQQFTTTCSTGPAWNRCCGVTNEYFEMIPAVVTTSIRFTGLDDCRNGGSGGIREIEIYGSYVSN